MEENNFEKLLKLNPALYNLFHRAAGIIVKKNHDYAGEDDFYRNFRRVENLGIKAWIGIAVRLEDKFARIENYVKTGTYFVSDESFDDTVIDMANYLLLMLGVYQEDKNNGTQKIS